MLRSLFATCRSFVRQQSSAVAALEHLESGSKLKVVWQDGQEATYHARWLRHNCKCPKCWEPVSGQKVLSTKELQGRDMSVRSATLSSEPKKTYNNTTA